MPRPGAARSRQATLSYVRRRFVDIAEEVRAGERLLVNRNGRPLVAIVSVEDATRLDAGQLAPPAPRPVDMAKVERIIRAMCALPIRDPRSSEEIIGYGDDGLPE